MPASISPQRRGPRTRRKSPPTTALARSPTEAARAPAGPERLALPIILDLVVELLDYETLVPLRGVSQHIRALVDTRLCRHLVVRSPSRRGEAGIHVHTLSAPRAPFGEPKSLPLPCFAFWPEGCSSPHSSEREWDEDWYDQQRGGNQRGTSIRRRRGPEADRAERWCRDAMVGTLSIDFFGYMHRHGTAFCRHGLPREGALRRVQTVRIFPDRKAQIPWHVPVSSQNLYITMPLKAHFLHGGSTPPPDPAVPEYGAEVRRLIVAISFYGLCSHSEALLAGLGITPSMEVVFLLNASNGYDEDEPDEPHPRTFGVLSNAMGDALRCLDRIKVTVVGLDAESARLLGLSYNELLTGPDGEMVNEYKKWDEISVALKHKLVDKVKDEVSSKCRYWGTGCSEGQVDAALNNFRVMSYKEWTKAARDSGQPADTSLETCL